jgi:trans-aconitate 2-methyltransferase
VVDRVALHGQERVLDAGCGTGQVTEYLRWRLPAGSVVALDGSGSMIEAARERLGEDRVTYLVHDLLEPIPAEPVDAVVSTATFHWVPDHDRLFANLTAVMRPGAQLAAQCGGAGNIANVARAASGLGLDVERDKVSPTPPRPRRDSRAPGSSTSTAG